MNILVPSALAVVIAVSATAAAHADEKTLLGFANSTKTLNDLLAEGYEFRSGSASFGVMVMLQKGASLALCGITPERNECQVTLDAAAARAAIQTLAAERAAAMQAGPKPTKPFAW